jgi:hypothetical protein
MNNRTTRHPLALGDLSVALTDFPTTVHPRVSGMPSSRPGATPTAQPRRPPHRVPSRTGGTGREVDSAALDPGREDPASADRSPDVGDGVYRDVVEHRPVASAAEAIDRIGEPIEAEIVCEPACSPAAKPGS